MEQLKINKTDFLRLAAIIANRHPQNEELIIQEMPICWKIQTINPFNNQESLVAYIHKFNDHDNPVLAAYSRLRTGVPFHNSEVPTLARRISQLHAVGDPNPRAGEQHY